MMHRVVLPGVASSRWAPRARETNKLIPGANQRLDASSWLAKLVAVQQATGNRPAGQDAALTNHYLLFFTMSCPALIVLNFSHSECTLLG